MEQHEHGTPASRRARTRGGEPNPALDDLPTGIGRRRWWRWSRLPGVLLAFVALVTLVGLLNGVRFMTEPTVTGARLVSEADVLATAAVSDQSVFLVRPAEVERRLVRAYGSIEAVTVTCQLPNLVQIDVQERANVLVWESGGQRWWVDDTGIVLGAATETRGLITIEDASDHMLSPEGYVPGVPWRMAQAVADQLRAAPRFYFQDYGLTLYVNVLGTDVPAYLGCEGDGAVKGAVLKALVEHLEERGIRPLYLDLSHDAFPVFKVAEG